MTDKGNRGASSAKPAGEPRPRFFYFSVEGQGTADIQERFGDSARDASRWFLKCWEADAARICAALNAAAETRAAQPPALEEIMAMLNAQALRLKMEVSVPSVSLQRLHAIDEQADFLIGLAKRIQSMQTAQPGDAPKLTGSQTSADFLATCKANGIAMVAMSVEEFQRRFDAALLASRSTPAAPAPASTEAPGTLSADEIVERCATAIEADVHRRNCPAGCHDADIRVVRALKGTFALPSTEALIAAGDALRVARLEGAIGEAEYREHADERCGIGEWSTTLGTTSGCTCGRDQRLAELRAAVAALHPANAARQ